MSEFPQFDTAKIMIAASVRHCRFTLEDLPVGQIIVDEFGMIKSIDVSTADVLGCENPIGTLVGQYFFRASKLFPTKFSPSHFGDLGEFQIRARDETLLPARVVCVPGNQPQTFLLSIVFSSP